VSRLIDEVEFRATSKRAPLPGLDDALTKLRALDTALKLVQNRLAGISTQSAFRQTAKQFEALVRDAGFTKAGSTGGSVTALAKRLGLPDVKDVRAYARQMEMTLQTEIAKIQRKIDGGLGARATANAQKKIDALLQQSFFTDASAKFLKNPRSAGRFFEQYGKAATAQEKTGRDALNAILQGRASSNAPVVVSAAPAPSASVPPSSSGASGSGGGGKVMQKFREDVAAVKRTLAETIEGGLNPQQIAAARSKAAAHIRTLADPLQNPGLKQESVTVQKALEDAAKLEKRATDARTKLRADAQQNIARTEDELAAAKEANNRAEQKALARRLSDQKKQLKQIETESRKAEAGQAKAGKSIEKYYRDVTRSDERRAKQAGKGMSATDYDTLIRTTHAAAAARLNDILATHSTAKSATETTSYAGKGGPQQGRKQTVTFEEGGRLHTVEATFTGSGVKLREFSRELKATREELGLLGGDFVRNTVKVAAWSASVGLLYTTLGLVQHSMTRVVEIGGQTARLEQVFNGVGGSAQELSDRVLHLAAVNGRSTEEAQQAAVQWSRLGLTQAQAIEGVRAALVSANVAELSAAEATEKLQAIMQNYNLRVGQLRTTLGELNQISNTYNVTNADMLEGIARTAAVAKQAGLPLQELMGLIGATVGSTGQTGANIGNAVKSVTLALSNPALQKKLREQFRFEVTDGSELKGLNLVLDDLFVRFQELDKIQKQSLLFNVGGKTQASRLAALLDNYVRAQMLAINAQLNLNSAEQENAKIKATLKSQLVGLTAEWERFVTVQGNRGPVQVLGEMTTALRNLLAIAGNPAISTLLTAVTGLAVVGSARAVLGGLRGGGPSFIGRTGQHLTQIASAASNLTGDVIQNAATRRVNSYAIRSTPYGPPLAKPIPLDAAGNPVKFNLWERGLQGYLGWTQKAIASNNLFAKSFGLIGQAAGAGLVVLSEFAIPIAVIGAAIYGFNRLMEGLGRTSEDAASELAGFAAHAEAAAAAANAASEGARLISTVQRALPSMPRPEQLKNLGLLAQSLAQDEANPKVRLEKTAALKAEFELLVKQNRQVELGAKLEQLRAEQIELARVKRQQEFVENQKAIERARAEVSRLEGKLFSDPKNLAEQRARLAELEGKGRQFQTDDLRDQDQERRDFLDNNAEHQTALKLAQERLNGIQELFRSIGTQNPFQRAVVDLSGLNAQLLQTEQKLGSLRRQEKNIVTGRSENLTRADEIAEEIKRRRLKFEAQRYQVPTDDNPFGSVAVAANEQARHAFNQQIEALQKQEALLRRDPNNLTDVRGQIDAAEKAKRELEQARSVLESNLGQFRTQTQFQFGRDSARRTAARSDFGQSETERLLRTQADLQEQINELEAKGQLNITDRGRQLALEEQRYTNLLALRERAFTVERDINQVLQDRAKEFQRSLFGAGPQELLRQLAALRSAFTKDGRLANLGPGAMVFGMSPEFRSSVGGAQAYGVANGATPPSFLLDVELQKLFGERGKLNGFKDDKFFDGVQMRLSERMGALTEQLAREVPAAFETGVQVLSAGINSVGRALEGLAVKLNNFTPGGNASAAPAPTTTGQFGGRGGGAGLLYRPQVLTTPISNRE
jgi:TP901 family phage tail tape measure protein